MMEEKSSIILAAEQAFARRVALGMSVKQPVKAWLQLIPGMFIFDFLKRQKEIRTFSEYYLFPRRPAIAACRAIATRADTKDALATMEDNLRRGMQARKLYGEAAWEALRKMVQLLTEHYSRIMQANGVSYRDLVEDVYHDRARYEIYLRQLTALEKEVDAALLEVAAATDSDRKRVLEQQQEIERMREQDLNAYFE